MPFDDIYNAGDVLEKTLIAAQPIKVYTQAPPYTAGFPLSDYLVGTVAPGNPVGVVSSYLAANPLKERNNLWWQFYPANNYDKFYYVEHKPGMFDVQSLRQQGVITTTEKIQQEQDANKPWYEKLGGTLVKGLMTVAGIGLGIYAIKSAMQTKK